MPMANGVAAMHAGTEPSRQQHLPGAYCAAMPMANGSAVMHAGTARPAGG